MGEDLELTWRIQEAGYEVEFVADAIILAEVPDNLPALWKQRVRWARGLLQTARLHKREFLTPLESMFHVFLPVNFFAQIIQPLLQLVAIVGIPLLVVLGLMGADNWTANLPICGSCSVLNFDRISFSLSFSTAPGETSATSSCFRPAVSLFLSCVVSAVRESLEPIERGISSGVPASNDRRWVAED